MYRYGHFFPRLRRRLGEEDRLGSFGITSPDIQLHRPMFIVMYLSYWRYGQRNNIANDCWLCLLRLGYIITEKCTNYTICLVECPGANYLHIESHNDSCTYHLGSQRVYPYTKSRYTHGIDTQSYHKRRNYFARAAK